MLTLLVVLATQSVTDTIAGTVTGPGGQPLAGAIVRATSSLSGLSRWRTSDAAGRFTIYFPGRAQYHLTPYYFGLVRARGSVQLWAREDRRAASMRLELAGFANPIDTILNAHGLLGLTGDQVIRLREIAAATDAFTLPVLERVRIVLTPSQWTRLSTEPLPGVAIRTQAGSVSRAPPSPAPSQAPSQRPVSLPPRPPVRLYTGVSTVYETNLDHRPSGLASYGVLLGVGGDYYGRWRRTTLEVQYASVFRRYTGTDVWNTPGHKASVAVSRRVARGWAVGADAGVQLNGSTEDRVLRNEYSAEANLEYRLSSRSRVQLYGEYMLKRYPDPQISRNAADPRMGLKYRQVLGASGTWGIGGRYNYNQADSSRYTYSGWTATTDITLPVGAVGRISTTLRYNVRQYSSRLIDVGGTQVLRRDVDRVATIAWQRGIARVWDVVASYRYEFYQSNDSTRTFRDDMFAVTLTRYW